MANDDPRAGTVNDPDGHEVVLLARIWTDKITRNHPELADHLDAVIQTVASPVTSSPTRFATAPGSAQRRAQPLADGGRKV